MMRFIIKSQHMKTITLILIALITAFTVTSQFNEKNTNKVNYRIVAFNNNNNEVESTSNTVVIAKRLHIQIPNAFSPDGDGVNDSFTAVSDGIEEFSMDVYNRWGEKVYHTDDVLEPWTGIYNGTKCQQDAYTYVIHARGLEFGSQTTMKGTVSLIR